MNEVQTVQSDCFYEILLAAYEAKLISAKRLKSLQSEWMALLRKRVKEWNHGNSTSLSRVHEQYLRRNLDYILCHGLSSSRIELQHEAMEAIFATGMRNLRHDQRRIQYYASFLRKQKLPFPNEYYQGVVKQIRRYIKNLQVERASFYFSHIQDDLDYPLLDGLPLYHDMYGLSGSDLVLYYTRCLAYEICSISFYRHELPQLFQHYQEKTKLSLQETLVNVCEFVIPQLLVHHCLYHSFHLQLTKQDITRFISSLHHDSNITASIQNAYEQFLAPLPVKVRDYMSQFEQYFISLLTKDPDHLASLLIFEDHDLPMVQVFLEQGSERSQFLHHLTMLSDLSCTDKIIYLNENVTSPYDLMDLLDHTLFYDEEYDQYFSTWAMSQLAIILRLIHPKYPFQNQPLSVFLAETEDGQEWQTYLYRYLLTLDESAQAQLSSILSQIILT